MIRSSKWRLVFYYGLIFAATLAATAAFMQRTQCAKQSSCLQSGIWVVAVIGLISFTSLTLYATSRREQAMHELTLVVRRAAEGDLDARILSRATGYEVELTRALNDMLDRFRQELRQYAQENQQLSIVFQNTADGVLITDLLGRVVLINPAASRMLAADAAKAVGRSFAEVVRHHQLIELWLACREGGKEAVAAVELDRNLFVQAFVTPFEESGARGFLVILQDLTQVRFLQTVRRDFISNLSHEFRTPLAAIRAIVETLQDGALDERELALGFLDRADGELDTLTQMVEELLELSRIESGEVPLRMTETEIYEFFEVPIERVRAQAEREQINIQVEIPDGLPAVLADADRMMQVVSNLLHNAVKFTSAGGTIRIAAYADSKDGDEIVMLVQDSGIGIAEGDSTRIFERFYKSDRARTRGQGEQVLAWR